MLSENVERKFIEKTDVSDWEIMTDHGFSPIKVIGKTVPYEIYELTTESHNLRCADTHIVFDSEYDEVFVKDLNKDSRPDKIITEHGCETVIGVKSTGIKENMYDIEVDDENHRYYTNGILSHNSIFLCNDAVTYIQLGKNVLFITCEMSAHKVLKRISANAFDIHIGDYDRVSQNAPYMKAKIEQFRKKNNVVPGRLFVEEFPTGCCTTIDVDNLIRRIEEINDITIDVIIIDYINIMANYRNLNTENTYMKIKQLSEDLRAVAVKRNKLIITATQSQRSAFDSADITMSQIAESAGMIHTCDTMLGIIQDTEMRNDNTYLLKIIKIRDGGGKNYKMKKKIDYCKMRILDTGFVTNDANQPDILYDDAARSLTDPTYDSKKTENQVVIKDISANNEFDGPGYYEDTNNYYIDENENNPSLFK